MSYAGQKLNTVYRLYDPDVDFSFSALLLVTCHFCYHSLNLRLQNRIGDMRDMGYFYLAQDKNKWRTLVNTNMNVQVP